MTSTKNLKSLSLLTILSKQSNDIVCYISSVCNLLKSNVSSLLVFIFRNHDGGSRSFDSSVGRAEDCRVCEVILRSLVRIRLEGHFCIELFFLQKKFEAYVLLVNYYYYNEPVEKSPCMLNLSASKPDIK